MSSECLETINVLDLPDEVLRKIFTYVPEQLVVGQVCIKFYEISCSIKSYYLSFRFHDDSSSNIESANIDDDEIFESIMRSSRKIKTLCIFGLRNFPGSRSRLKEIIEYVSDNVVIVHIRLMSAFLEDWELLNLMPNTKKLILIDTNFENLEFCQNFKLRLRNLVELTVYRSNSEVLEAFDELPDNVLRKLRLFYISNSTKKYFQNQNCLDEINTNSLDLIDMKNKKLKKAHFNVTRNFKDINQIEGQDEITTLRLELHFKHQEVVDLVCRDYKSIENLELSSVQTINLAELQNLKKMKKVVITKSLVATCAPIRSKSLEVLEINWATEECLMNISINCPNLRELKLSCIKKDDVTVSQVLQCLPRIEKLSFFSISFEYVSSFEHLNLKHLTCLFYDHNEPIFDNFFSVVSGCKSLETLSIDFKFENEEFKTLLQSCPNLKSLCLRGRMDFQKVFDEGFFEVLKTYGQNLHSVHLQSSRYNEVYKSPTELLKRMELFKDQFQQFTFKGEPIITACLMRKTGNETNCCEFT